MLTIRVFEPKDQPDLIDLWQRCQLIVPWNDPCKDIARKMRVNPELFLVGEMDGRLIASVMGGYDGHRGWINYLAVAPEYQRRGIGQRMMAEVERRIQSKGCPKINIQVRSTNATVIAFYNSLGYGVDDVIGLGKRLEKDD